VRTEVFGVGDGDELRSALDTQAKVRVTGVANESVEAVEVTTQVESRLSNKAKASAAAKTTTKTRAKTVEIRMLLIFREDQWRLR